MYPRQRFDLLLPGGGRLSLGDRTLVMGILNVTPDSFADGGRFASRDEAVGAALEMEAAGADLIDIGGESTRPGAEVLEADAERARVLPVIQRLVGRLRVPISIDTYKADVAHAALEEGAVIVNDVSGLRYDAALGPVVARSGAGLVLMHTRGRSRRMYREANYQDVVGEVVSELEQSMTVAEFAGVPRDRLVLDPGIGFAKRPEHSWAVLAGVPRLAAVGRPVLVGPSRKSFLQGPLGKRPPAGRGWGTAAAVAASVWFGAHIVRVHDVPEMVDVVRVADAIRAQESSG